MPTSFWIGQRSSVHLFTTHKSDQTLHRKSGGEEEWIDITSTVLLLIHDADSTPSFVCRLFFPARESLPRLLTDCLRANWTNYCPIFWNWRESWTPTTTRCVFINIRSIYIFTLYLYIHLSVDGWHLSQAERLKVDAAEYNQLADMEMNKGEDDAACGRPHQQRLGRRELNHMNGRETTIGSYCADDAGVLVDHRLDSIREVHRQSGTQVHLSEVL